MSSLKVLRPIVGGTALLLLYLTLSRGPADIYFRVKKLFFNVSPCEHFPHKIGIEELQKYSLEDEALVDYIRCHHLFPPSKKPYPEHMRKGNPSEFQREEKRLFSNKKNGVFIECGANDGLLLSNTLVLERDQGWTGLLIEANPQMHPLLKAANRKAWVADVCLSPDNTISEMNFFVSNRTKYHWEAGLGKIDMKDDIDTLFLAHTDTYNFKPYGLVRCFPFTLVLKAANIHHVDYFSLDVQGVELKILKTLPFDNSMKFDVINAEFILDPEGKASMERFMRSKGYKIYAELKEIFIFTRL